MRRAEVPNNTAEQVHDYLRQALDLTVQLEPPDDLAATVFGKAADLIAAKQILLEQAGPMVAGIHAPGVRL